MSNSRGKKSGSSGSFGSFPANAGKLSEQNSRSYGYASGVDDDSFVERAKNGLSDPDDPARRHIIAEATGPLSAWSPNSPGWRRLAGFLGSDPEAHDAWFAHVEHIRLHGGDRPSFPTPPATAPRRSAAVVEAFDRADRDAERQRLLAEMGQASPERRRLLAEQAGTLHSAAERRWFRGRALRRLHRAAYAELTERGAAQAILADLKRRSGAHVTSTGSNERDRLCDEIILAGSIPSDRTIREFIAP